MRLCCLQEELGRLNLKKASLGATLGISGYKTLEDFVYNQIDFSRYRNLSERDFERLFPEGLTDFEEGFFKKNFGLGINDVKSVIEGSYQKAEGEYRLQRENPIILSIMRTLETSLEAVPLFTPEEIIQELQNWPGFDKEEILPEMKKFYPLLVSSLDNALVTHSDNMTTRLFISPEGDLSGTFRPGGKPWTLVLIPAGVLRN